MKNISQYIVTIQLRKREDPRLSYVEYNHDTDKSTAFFENGSTADYSSSWNIYGISMWLDNGAIKEINSWKNRLVFEEI